MVVRPVANNSNTLFHFVAYIRIQLPQEKRRNKLVTLSDRLEIKNKTVYLGSIGLPTRAEAEAEAKHLVNTTPTASRGSILPRVFVLDLSLSYEVNPLYDAMCRAQDWFEKKIMEMNETLSTIPDWRKV